MPKNMTNIAQLLKDAPTGMKLYSPLFGEVKLKYINDSTFGIVVEVEGAEKCYRSFNKYGQYFTEYSGAECLLFPGEDCRTWEGWEAPVKPKFKFKVKVGDWIVQNDNGTVSQITKTINGKDEHGEYRAYEHTNGYFAACFEDEFHLWTLADVKYGDVLANTAGCILIVKDNESCLCYIDKNGEFHADNNKWFFVNFLDNALTPATKEQQKLLFHKMKEASYQWDADKKELRKIKVHYDISSFYAGMPVLVRDFPEENWQYVHFSNYVHYDGGVIKFWACGVPWRQCIPFNEETKHLLGTTDMPSEEFINW